MSARDRILGRLRAATPNTAPPRPDVLAFYTPVSGNTTGGTTGTTTAAERRQRFCDRMTFWRGEIVTVNVRNWTSRLRELCAAKGIRSLCYGPQGEHGPALAAAGIPGLKPYDRPVDEWKQELFEATDAGFTATRGAIAETGTLILWPGPAEPRLLSLVPPIHFALLDARKIHDTLFDAMTSEGWGVADRSPLPTNALLVSGPSKTADIQQTLAYGAHGPKELVVLLLVDEPAEIASVPHVASSENRP